MFSRRLGQAPPWSFDSSSPPRTSHGLAGCQKLMESADRILYEMKSRIYLRGFFQKKRSQFQSNTGSRAAGCQLPKSR